MGIRKDPLGRAYRARPYHKLCDLGQDTRSLCFSIKKKRVDKMILKFYQVLRVYDLFNI